VFINPKCEDEVMKKWTMMAMLAFATVAAPMYVTAASCGGCPAAGKKEQKGSCPARKFCERKECTDAGKCAQTKECTAQAGNAKKACGSGSQKSR
jgi:hypothetical protein